MNFNQIFDFPEIFELNMNITIFKLILKKILLANSIESDI